MSVKEPVGNRKIYWTFFDQLSQVSKFSGDLFLAPLAITDGMDRPDLGLARGCCQDRGCRGYGLQVVSQSVWAEQATPLPAQ